MSSKGILEIGKNCHYCHHVDFLPFNCEKCGYEFCSSHRFQHECEKEVKQLIDEQKQQQLKHKDLKNTGKSQNVSEVSRLFQEAKQPKSYELDKLRREKYGQINNEKFVRLKDGKIDTLGNLKKFISSQLQLLKNSLSLGATNSGRTISKKPTDKQTSRIVEISKIRNDKELKGDSNIQNADRIYVWAYVVPNDKTSMNDVGSLSGKVPTKQVEKKAVFISKNWPVGKATDSLAAVFKVKNENSKTTDFKHKLNLFKSVEILNNNSDLEPVFEFNGDTAQYLRPSSRVVKEIQSGDTLHLIRGADVSHFL